MKEITESVENMISMKKTGIILLAILLLVLPVAGCSGRGSSGADKAYDPQVVAQAILENVTFKDTLVQAQGAVAENYYMLDDTIAAHAIYISGSGGTAEEIAVLKVTDKKALDAAKKILENRVEELKFRFESYVPTEMVKLRNPVIVLQGDVAVLVIADDKAAAEEAVKNALA